jgi:hypothetical protein
MFTAVAGAESPRAMSEAGFILSRLRHSGLPEAASPSSHRLLPDFEGLY